VLYDRVGANGWQSWRGRVRDCRSTMVAAHAPAHRGIFLGFHFGYCWYRRNCWNWWCTLLLLVLRSLLLLLLGASHASIARHFLARRGRWGNCLCSHAGTCMQCYAALLECKGQQREAEVRGSQAGQTTGQAGKYGWSGRCKRAWCASKRWPGLADQVSLCILSGMQEIKYA
jgi:hypothetical protein